METRRMVQAAIALLVIIVSLIGASLAVVVSSYRSGGGPGQPLGFSATPIPAVTPTPVGGTGRLLILGADSRLALVGAGGAERELSREVTSDGYLYPAPSPDGSRVAYTTQTPNGTAVVVLDLATDRRTEVFVSKAIAGLLYMSWSPNGRYIAFLTASSSQSLGVFLVPADGSAPAREVAQEPQLRQAYFAWSADGGRLLMHLNGTVFEQGRLASVESAGGAARPFDVSLGLFSSPAWSSDGGQVFYVAQPPLKGTRPSDTDLVSVLTRAAPDGSGTTELAREQSAVLSFLRSPTSDQIAYTTFNIVKGEFGPLVLVDGRSGERRVLSAAGEHAVALFWSPDGRELAYLTRDDDRDRSSKHTWHVVDTAGGAPRELARFTPSATFTRMLSFFDTYALSFSLWSPDATHLTYAAADGVYTLDLVSGTPTRIGAGDLALWVP